MSRQAPPSSRSAKRMMRLERAGLLLLLGIITGCDLGPRGSLATSTPLDRWVLAVQQRDYAMAQTLMREDDVPAWQAATDQLFRQHQGPATYQRLGDETRPNQNPIIITRWSWNDGTSRCLRVQQTPTGKLDILDPGYYECSVGVRDGTIDANQGGS